MATQAKTTAEPITVTEENFRQAESDLYFRNSIKAGGDGKFHHIRGAMPIDNQTVIRAIATRCIHRQYSISMPGR